MILNNMTDKNKLLLFEVLEKYVPLPFNFYIIHSCLMEYNVVKCYSFYRLLYS